MIVLKKAKTATGLASCVFAGLALTASPGAADGFYVQAWGGVSLQRDQFSGGATAGGDPRAVDIDFDPGLAVGGGIGWLLDEWLGTRPWLFVVFIFVGIAAGILNAFRAAQRMGATPLSRESAEERGEGQDGRSQG